MNLRKKVSGLITAGIFCLALAGCPTAIGVNPIANDPKVNEVEKHFKDLNYTVVPFVFKDGTATVTISANGKTYNEIVTISNSGKIVYGGLRETTATSTPVLRDFSAPTISSSSVVIKFAADNANTVEVRRGGSLIRTLTSEREFTDSGLNAGTSYSYEFKAINSNGNTSVFTYAVTTTSNNSFAPVLRDFSASTITANSVVLKFAADNSNTIEVRRGGSLIRTLTSEREFTDSGLNAGTSYSYEFKAINSNGNTSVFTYTVITSSSGANTIIANLLGSVDTYVYQNNGVKMRQIGSADNRLSYVLNNNSGDFESLNFTGGTVFNGTTFGVFVNGSEYNSGSFRRTFSGGSANFTLEALPSNISSASSFTLQIKSVDGSNVGSIYQVNVRRDN